MKFYRVSCAALATVLLLSMVGCKTDSNSATSDTALLATDSQKNVDVLVEQGLSKIVANERAVVETVNKKGEQSVATTKKVETVTTEKKQSTAQKVVTEQPLEKLYFKTNKYSVVSNDLNAAYTTDMHYVEVDEYVFVFGSSNIFKVNYNGSSLSVPEAYKQGIISKSELKQLYDSFPATYKMSLKQYLLTEKYSLENREFIYPTDSKVDYCDDSVIVILGDEISKKKYTFTAEDFAEAGIGNIASVQNNIQSNGKDQFVYLTLEKTGLENVTKAIQSISKLPGVRCAEPDAWYTLETVE